MISIRRPTSLILIALITLGEGAWAGYCDTKFSEAPRTAEQVRADALAYITWVDDIDVTLQHVETRKLLHAYGMGQPAAQLKGEKLMHLIARVLDHRVTPQSPMSNMPYDLLYRIANNNLTGEAYLQRAKDKAKSVLRRLQPMSSANWMNDYEQLVNGQTRPDVSVVEAHFALAFATSLRNVDPALLTQFAKRELSPSPSARGVELYVQAMRQIAQELTKE